MTPYDFNVGDEAWVCEFRMSKKGRKVKSNIPPTKGRLADFYLSIKPEQNKNTNVPIMFLPYDDDGELDYQNEMILEGMYLSKTEKNARDAYNNMILKAAAKMLERTDEILKNFIGHIDRTWTNHAYKTILDAIDGTKDVED